MDHADEESVMNDRHRIKVIEIEDDRFVAVGSDKLLDIAQHIFDPVADERVTSKQIAAQVLVRKGRSQQRRRRRRRRRR